MQTIDLNINLLSFQNYDNIPTSLQDLIGNEYVHLSPMNENKDVDLQYDESTETLKIIHHQWTITTLDFMVTSSTNEYNVNFLLGIINLVMKDYQLTIKSKGGTFTPIIKSQTNKNNSIPCLFINYDESQSNTHTDTVITVSPVSMDLIIKLKNNFSWTQQWDKVIKTNGGYLLINKNKEINNCYLNGQILGFDPNFEPKLMYSYDVSENFPNQYNDDEVRDDNWMTEHAILSVLSSLNEKDKVQIYQTIFNNDKCLEWQFATVQTLILNYYITMEKQKEKKCSYVLLPEDANPLPDYVAAVEVTGATIIPVNYEAYKQLYNQTWNVHNYALTLLANYYKDTKIPTDQLTKFQRSMLKVLDDFLADFANHYEPFKKWLIQNKLDQLPIGFVKDYPTHTGTYNELIKTGMMDIINLENFGYMFYTAHMIVWQAIESKEIDYYDFQKIWQVGSMNFLTAFFASSNEEDKKEK